MWPFLLAQNNACALHIVHKANFLTKLPLYDGAHFNERVLIVPSTTLQGVDYTPVTESSSVFETQLSSSDFYTFTLCITIPPCHT